MDTTNINIHLQTSILSLLPITYLSVGGREFHHNNLK